MDYMADNAEDLVRVLYKRFGREVAVSFSLDSPPGGSVPWTVMVEGDRGACSGMTLVEALRNRLEGSEPEGQHGWGVDAE